MTYEVCISNCTREQADKLYIQALNMGLDVEVEKSEDMGDMPMKDKPKGLLGQMSGDGE